MELISMVVYYESFYYILCITSTLLFLKWEMPQDAKWLFLICKYNFPQRVGSSSANRLNYSHSVFNGPAFAIILWKILIVLMNSSPCAIAACCTNLCPKNVHTTTCKPQWLLKCGSIFCICFLLWNCWSIPGNQHNSQDKMLLLDCMLCGEETGFLKLPSSVLEKQFAHWQ